MSFSQTLKSFLISHIKVLLDATSTEDTPLHAVADPAVVELLERVDGRLHRWRRQEGDKVARVDGDGNHDKEPPEADDQPARVRMGHDYSGWHRKV